MPVGLFSEIKGCKMGETVQRVKFKIFKISHFKATGDLRLF